MGLLDGKVAIVTASAGAGIGQATVRLMLDEGASVVVSDAHARRVGELVDALAKEYGEDRVIGAACDVTDEKAINDMVEKTLEKFGRIDILVNNAGRNKLAMVQKMTDELWDLVIDVNLKGTFLCTKAVVPTMIKQGSGRIISIASVEGWIGSPMGEAQYGATKAGIMGFTKSLSKELAEHGILVNAIAPGVIPNPFLRKIYGPMLDTVPKLTPIGRGGEPKEIAGAAVFLASDLSNYVLGETLVVCGGLYFH